MPLSVISVPSISKKVQGDFNHFIYPIASPFDHHVAKVFQLLSPATIRHTPRGLDERLGWLKIPKELTPLFFKLASLYSLHNIKGPSGAIVRYHGNDSTILHLPKNVHIIHLVSSGSESPKTCGIHLEDEFEIATQIRSFVSVFFDLLDRSKERDASIIDFFCHEVHFYRQEKIRIDFGLLERIRCFFSTPSFFTVFDGLDCSNEDFLFKLRHSSQNSSFLNPTTS